VSSSKLRQICCYNSVVGAVLAVMRRQESFDQRTMAGKMGLTQSTWSRIETGISQITVGQLAAAARVLHTHPAKILGLADALAANLKSGGVRVEDRLDGFPEDRALVIDARALDKLATEVLLRE
jgi:transcriptional regulator with XRE-family HTH domain